MGEHLVLGVFRVLGAGGGGLCIQAGYVVSLFSHLLWGCDRGVEWSEEGWDGWRDEGPQREGWWIGFLRRWIKDEC